MKERIDETLRRLAAGTSKASSPTTSSTNDTSHPKAGLPGDPECPICGGVGFVRLDLPVGHPDFGKLQICACRSKQVNQEVRQRLFSISQLEELRYLTFENFEPRGRFGLPQAQADSVEWAYNHANQYAQALEGWLLLMGDYGCGKTHLAAAIGNFAANMGVPTLFITVPDLLDSLRRAYNDPDATFEERFEEVRSVPLLIMDDFGTQNATAWAQEKLFQIINYRYINRLPLVVTTNLNLEEIEGRIRSRLNDPNLVTRLTIQAPDYRQPATEFGDHELSSLNLLATRTFASFDLRRGEGLDPSDLKNLQIALNAAQEFAQKPQGWLMFIGAYGCGKTHLAAAIANDYSHHGPLPLFVVVPDLLDHLRATFSPQSNVTLDRRFEEVRRSPLLILDDLGTQSTTPWVKEKLYQLFNYRYNAELPTVITTTKSLEEIQATEPRLASRMLDRRLCRIVAITAPSYTGGPPLKTNRRRGKR